MIWFFLMGMIAGAACLILYAHRWMKKHTTVIEIPNEEESDD